MRIVKPDAQYIDVDNIHPYQMMEKAGRTCYKSEKNITAESAARFVKNLAEHKHTAMLEHAHIYLKINKGLYDKLSECLKTIAESDEESMDTVAAFIKLTHFIPDLPTDQEAYYLSGSFRTFLNMFYSDVSYIFEPVVELKKELSDTYPEIFEPDESLDEISHIGAIMLSREEFIKDVNALPARDEQKKAILMKHVVHTVVFTCDRGVTHEFVRHRPASFAQESSRYCNYSQDKFGNEISVIDPCFWQAEDKKELLNLWLDAIQYCEKIYFKMLELGATPQEARSVLPNSLKTELVITATESEWLHIINLRLHGTTGAPHPQIKEVMGIAYPELIEHSNGRLS